MRDNSPINAHKVTRIERIKHYTIYDQHTSSACQVTYQVDRHISQSSGAEGRRSSHGRRWSSAEHCCQVRRPWRSPRRRQCTSLGYTRCWTRAQCWRRPAALPWPTPTRCDASAHCCGNTWCLSSARPAERPAAGSWQLDDDDGWTTTSSHHRRPAEYSVSAHGTMSTSTQHYTPHINDNFNHMPASYEK